MNFSTVDTRQVTATSVQIDEDSLTVDLADGRSISVPVAWFPRLANGTSAERANWRFIANGSGMHWPDLDEDISVENLLLGQPSAESQASFKQWLARRQTKQSSL